MPAYEEHITVEDMSIELFREKCETNAALKPVIISGDTGSSRKYQMMTSRIFSAQSLEEAKEVSFCDSELLQPYVIRIKLEILSRNSFDSEKYLYPEYHMKFEIPKILEGFFIESVRELKVHTAKNILSQDENNKEVVSRWVTTRNEEKYEEVVELLSQKYRLLKTYQERVVYDSNPNIDDIFICECPLKELKVVK